MNLFEQNLSVRNLLNYVIIHQVNFDKYIIYDKSEPSLNLDIPLRSRLIIQSLSKFYS